MTRPRAERLATLPADPVTPRAVLASLDATARKLAAAIDPWPCGCWLVQMPDGVVRVHCEDHAPREDT